MPQVYRLKSGETAVIHSGCQASIQLDGNYVASRPGLKHRHKNTWLSPNIARDLRAEVLLAKVHELAIKQELVNYETKTNVESWYRESKLHAAYGGTIIIVVVCVVVLSCIVCYCNYKLQRQTSGIVVNQIKMSIKRKVLFSKENTTKGTDTSIVTFKRKESTTSLAIEIGNTSPSGPPMEKCESSETCGMHEDKQEETPLMETDKLIAQRIEDCKKRAESLPLTSQ